MAIKLQPQQTDDSVASLKKYFSTELELELSELRAGMLLDYILKEIAPLAYNQGVSQAEEFMRSKLEDMTATCFEPELTYWHKKRK
jgi:uncharacterized protein (DUF2164 family)